MIVTVEIAYNMEILKVAILTKIYGRNPSLDHAQI